MEIPFKVSEDEQLDIKIKWAAALLRNGEEVLREIRKGSLETEIE